LIKRQSPAAKSILLLAAGLFNMANSVYLPAIPLHEKAVCGRFFIVSGRNSTTAFARPYTAPTISRFPFRKPSHWFQILQLHQLFDHISPDHRLSSVVIVFYLCFNGCRFYELYQDNNVVKAAPRGV
jgi:hypothetical protein